MVKKITLENGVRIVHEYLPHLSSCALGLWVESGSRHEPEELCGISHFIEHMLFKGTETQTAAQLAATFDAIGGQVNAFTTKEHTCFYGRTLGAHLAEAAEVLCDMFFHSTFKAEDVDLERSVILEEIGMYEDTPEDLVNEELFAAVYGGYPLGRPILGTKRTLDKIGSKELLAYQKQNYTPENTVVALCGKYTEDDLAKLCARFEKMERGEAPARGEAKYQPKFTFKQKDTEQNHLIVGFPGIPLGSEMRFTMQALNNILGGGMSSRLFQKVREQSGLCYTLYSFSTSYFGTGVFGVYTALGRDTELKALELIRSEIDRFMKDGVTQEELDRTKEQLKCGLLMGMENTTSRMTSIARNELIYGKAVEEEELLKALEAVSRDDVVELGRKLFDFDKLSFSAVGKVRGEDEYKKALSV